jgi:aspartate racemase
MKNKSIGILGLGNRSTLFYVDELNKKFNSLFEGYSTCPFILYNTNFDNVNPYLPNNFSKLEPLLLHYIKKIKELGINFLLVPNISLHETLDRINIDLEIAHPVQLTIDKLMESKQTEAVIFGSLYSMQSNYLKKTFLQRGILLVEPVVEHKKFIDYIRKQIYYDQESKRDMEEYRRLLNLYSKDRALIIACTELSVYTSQIQNNIFDMASLQIEKTLALFKK